MRVFPTSASSLAGRSLASEIAGWRNGLLSSGWVPHLEKALSGFRGPELLTRKAELRQLVTLAGAQYGLEAFRALPRDPARRSGQMALFHEVCSWREGLASSGWGSHLTTALHSSAPDFEARKAELQVLVQKAGAQHGLETFRALPRDRAKKALQTDLFEEICAWREGLATSGWGSHLMKALDPSAPDFEARKTELRQLVETAGSQYGLEAFQALPRDPAARAGQVALFGEIGGWRAGLAGSGWGSHLMRALDASAPDYQARKAELRELVAAAGAQHGLESFQALPEEAGARQEHLGLYREAFSLRPGLAESGWGPHLVKAVMGEKDPSMRAEFRNLLKVKLPGQGAQATLDEMKTLRSLATRGLAGRLVFRLASETGSTGDLLPICDFLDERLTRHPVPLEERLSGLEPARSLELLRYVTERRPDNLDAELTRLAPMLARSTLSVAEVAELALLADPATAGQALGETEERWIIAGVPVKKRET